MSKIFKSKRRRNRIYIIWIIIFILSIFINLKYINKDSLLNDKINITFDKERILLNLGLNYNKKIEVKNKSKITPVFKENIIKKTILLYTTHEEENYVDGNIKDAEKYLYNLLINNNYNVIMDSTNITKEINDNKLNYKDTYKITRRFLEENLSDEVSLAIDLHRDSGVKTIYNNYAKLMFVIGMKHNTYKDNYQVADSINKMIENINSNITRGIYTRKSSSYNQDLNPNVILIELGSNNNKIGEVKNTIKVLVDAINMYLGE